MNKRLRSPRGERSVLATPTVVCFGEVLWDCLPKGIFLGGAPLNVAYHLAKQHVHAIPLSAVGCDFLGDEVVRRLDAWDMDHRGITRDPTHPTGTVSAMLDAGGSASYEIARNVAWDHIKVAPWIERMRAKPDAILFGTLALRSSNNRAVLRRALTTWPEAVRVVDLNFRPPFDSQKVTAFALAQAQLVKLNNLELARLTGKKGDTSKAVVEGARRLSDQYELPRICVTAGEHGAGLWWDGQWHWENARRIKVRDTVGAGDAFLAGLLTALFVRRAPPEAALAYACRIGEFVASQDGATPDYSLDRKQCPR
ncbi:MAG: PfkB family carbohydrate kinase [Opitutus sp.]